MRRCAWCREIEVPVASIEGESGEDEVCQSCVEDTLGPVRMVNHLYNIGANTIITHQWRVSSMKEEATK